MIDRSMKKKLLFTLVVVSGCISHQQPESTVYTLVTYNIENLFDADGVAVFNDYKPADREGNPQYTPRDVLTKIQNAIQVLQQYNEGKGPDVIAMVELESDFTSDSLSYADEADFLGRFAHTTLEEMLTTELDDEVKDLPSEWLLLKGMIDAGMWNYDLEVGYSKRNEDGEPETVQKVVTYSRLTILKDKTRIHYTERARPILETWIEVGDNELAVFNNHWKSGAGNPEMEQIRLKNARVLRDRLEQILSEDPYADIILAGDFNSDYNQKARYAFETTAVNDVLGSTGDESEGVRGPSRKFYNLWYEWPIDDRGSDTYRGYWGTLMQLMISSGMRDGQGFQYVDDSFSVGDFGFNTYPTSGAPRRWSSAFSGSGYSDHLPLSMKFKIPEEIAIYIDLSVNDDSLWRPIPVNYSIPEDYLTMAEFNSGDPASRPDFYDAYFFLTATVTEDYDFVIDGTAYDVYAPSFRLSEVLSGVAGASTEVQFYGRFSQYRGNWQFVVEDPGFITIPE